MNGLGGSLTQPTSTVTPQSDPRGRWHPAICSPNAAPVLFDFPISSGPESDSLLVSTKWQHGFVGQPKQSAGSWQFVVKHFGRWLVAHTITFTQQGTGALASVSSTYDAKGALTQVTENFANGNSISFDAHTYSNISFDAQNNLLHATLTSHDTTTLGVLTLSPFSGTSFINPCR